MKKLYVVTAFQYLNGQVVSKFEQRFYDQNDADNVMKVLRDSEWSDINLEITSESLLEEEMHKNLMSAIDSLNQMLDEKTEEELCPVIVNNSKLLH